MTSITSKYIDAQVYVICIYGRQVSKQPLASVYMLTSKDSLIDFE